MLLIKSSIKRNWKDILIITAVYAIVSFIFLTKSPIHPWKKSDIGTDSSVFKTIAFMMEKGYSPYRDSFDHKGPVIYILNYLGNLISPYSGIWIIEYVFLALTFVLNHYTVNKILKVSNILSFIAVLTGAGLLFTYFDGGNLVEEYAMPFISIGNLVFLDCLINYNYAPYKTIICGASFAIVLLLRANMIGLWIVFVITVFFKMLSQRKLKELLSCIGWFVLGVCIIAVPIICWMLVKDIIKEFWFDYIQFNLIYSSAEGGRATIESRWGSFFYFFNTTVFAISS